MNIRPAPPPPPPAQLRHQFRPYRTTNTIELNITLLYLVQWQTHTRAHPGGGKSVARTTGTERRYTQYTFLTEWQLVPFVLSCKSSNLGWWHELENLISKLFISITFGSTTKTPNTQQHRDYCTNPLPAHSCKKCKKTHTQNNNCIVFQRILPFKLALSIFHVTISRLLFKKL